MELMWIEYTRVPSSCLQLLEETGIPRLLSLDHPNLLKYYAAWVDMKEAKACFISEIPTANMRKFLSRKVQMMPNVFKGWLHQILLGVSYLHAHTPIPHDDLKCENIFIRSNNGQVKIGGLERTYFIHGCHPAAYPFAETTPGFSAAEFPHTIKSDVWSLGMVLMEMLTLQYPYEELRCTFQIFDAQLRSTPPRALATLKDEDLARIVNLCLKPHEERPTVVDLLALPYFDSVRQGAAAAAAAAAMGAQPVSVSAYNSSSGTGIAATASAGMPNGATPSASGKSLTAATSGLPLSSPNGAVGGGGGGGGGGTVPPSAASSLRTTLPAGTVAMVLTTTSPGATAQLKAYHGAPAAVCKKFLLLFIRKLAVVVVDVTAGRLITGVVHFMHHRVLL